MRELKFTKMVASGNDFVVVEPLNRLTVEPWRKLAIKMCDRKFGIGADGLLVIEKSKAADVRMRIFNADGSEAEMCGNGARCTGLWANLNLKIKNARIQTKAGIIESQTSKDFIKIKLTDPAGLKLNFPIKVSGRPMQVNFINTGVPHTVIFVEGLDKIDVENLGREIRYHKAFSPKGTNVNFAEVLNNNSIKLRTYERGVEGQTLACGTGSVASALIFSIKTDNIGAVNIQTESGEVLKVYFDRYGNNFKNVWLQGRAKIIYKGVYYV